MKLNRIMVWLNIILNGSKQSHKLMLLHKLFRKTLSIIVIINITTVILSSFNQFQHLDTLFKTISYFSTLIFVVEYVLRLYSAPAKRQSVNRGMATIQYATSFMGVVDLITIFPFIIQFFEIPNIYTYAYETSKIFLILKLVRYSSTFQLIIEVFRSVKMELLFGWTISLSIILFSGVLMYYIEKDAQPTVFYDVGQGLWWSVITFSTVGYGDISPITGSGKLIAGFLAIIGIGMLALPAGIISSAFVKKMTEIKQQQTLLNNHNMIKSIIDEVNNANEHKQDDIKHNNSDTINSKKGYCSHCGSKLDH